MSKNTSRNQIRGISCEQLVHEYFLSKGYLKKDPQNYSKIIQIDGLYFSETQGWLIVEVKSQPKTSWPVEERVSKKQKYRLQNFLKILSEESAFEVRALLAVVSQEGEIHLYEDFLCD